MAADFASVFGGKQIAPRELDNDKKKKTTGMKLETITVDEFHDLTLVIGTPEHARGQKAFHVNKGSFRNASPVWSAMLSGNWAESDELELSFPDDSCFAFQIVLQILHWQLSALPASLTRSELLEIAVLSDKYDLSHVLRGPTELKQWLLPYKGSGHVWPINVDLQDFTRITAAFGVDRDHRQLVNRLALDLWTENGCYYYRHDSKKAQIRSDFPAQILSEY